MYIYTEQTVFCHVWDAAPVMGVVHVSSSSGQSSIPLHHDVTLRQKLLEGHSLVSGGHGLHTQLHEVVTMDFSSWNIQIPIRILIYRRQDQWAFIFTGAQPPSRVKQRLFQNVVVNVHCLVEVRPGNHDHLTWLKTALQNNLSEMYRCASLQQQFSHFIKYYKHLWPCTWAQFWRVLMVGILNIR